MLTALLPLIYTSSCHIKPNVEQLLEGVQIEYVTEKPGVDADSFGEGFEDFVKVFEKFTTVEAPKEVSAASFSSALLQNSSLSVYGCGV